ENGATGIIFYSYYDMVYEKYPRGESTKNMELFNKRWADAAGMAHEIGHIVPAILNGSKVPCLSCGSQLNFSCVSKSTLSLPIPIAFQKFTAIKIYLFRNN